MARALADGESPVNEAALVKDLGTRFEQESVDLAADLLSYVGSGAAGREHVAAMVEIARLHAPAVLRLPTRCCAGWSRMGLR